VITFLHLYTTSVIQSVPQTLCPHNSSTHTTHQVALDLRDWWTFFAFSYLKWISQTLSVKSVNIFFLKLASLEKGTQKGELHVCVCVCDIRATCHKNTCKEILLLLPGFYSPIQAKTALTMPLHRILCDAISFQFLTPSVCRSCWTLSNHLTGGLPFFLFPLAYWRLVSCRD
jgi:hypothetical protein